MGRGASTVPSHQALVILGAIFGAESEQSYGGWLTELTGIHAGTLYPLLSRLAKEGILLAMPEQGDPFKLGRPLRTYYVFSKKGKKFATTYQAILQDALALNQKIMKADPPLMSFKLFS